MKSEPIELPHLSKREWDALGTLLLPPDMGGKTSLGPKTSGKLLGLGLVEQFIENLPSMPGDPAWMKLRIKGYRLTSRGHLYYCTWAGQQPIDEADQQSDEIQQQEGDEIQPNE